VTAELRCDRCKTLIAADIWNRPGGGACSICGRWLWASVFPALSKVSRGSAAAAIQAESEAACYYHPASRAQNACDSCGRFICALCDLDVEGRHLCPSCLHTPSGTAPEAVRIVDNRRVLYDSIVLALAIGGPVVFLWPSLVTGPLSVVLAIWYWKRPRSIVPRTPVRFILAILLGLLQCAFWVAIFWAISMVPRPKS
jgi:hypothetical protein